MDRWNEPFDSSHQIFRKKTQSFDRSDQMFGSCSQIFDKTSETLREKTQTGADGQETLPFFTQIKGANWLFFVLVEKGFHPHPSTAVHTRLFPDIKGIASTSDTHLKACLHIHPIPSLQIFQMMYYLAVGYMASLFVKGGLGDDDNTYFYWIAWRILGALVATGVGYAAAAGEFNVGTAVVAGAVANFAVATAGRFAGKAR